MVALVQGIVDDVNRERSRYEQIKRFVILPRDFTMEQDEVTPTLKLKRRAIMKNFADAVDAPVRAVERALRPAASAGQRRLAPTQPER